MEQELMQELETKLAQLEGGAAIYEVVKNLASRVGELETATALLAEGFEQLAAAVRGLAKLDAEQQAALAKLRKPKPEPGDGGKKAN